MRFQLGDSIYEISWAGLVTLLFSVAFMAIVIGGLIHRWWRDKGQRPRRARGRLVDKREAPAPMGTPFGPWVPSAPSTCTMRFAVQGRILTFDVDALLYDTIEVGQEAALTYRGRHLIDVDTGDAPPDGEDDG